jgi:hypothetical protein
MAGTTIQDGDAGCQAEIQVSRLSIARETERRATLALNALRNAFQPEYSMTVSASRVCVKHTRTIFCEKSGSHEHAGLTHIGLWVTRIRKSRSALRVEVKVRRRRFDVRVVTFDAPGEYFDTPIEKFLRTSSRQTLFGTGFQGGDVFL